MFTGATPERIVLTNGITVVVMRQQFGLLLAISLVFRISATADRSHITGAYLLARVWALKLQDSAVVIRLGAAIRPIATHDYIGVEVEMLAKDGQQGLEYLPDLLQNLSLRSDLIKPARQHALRDLQRTKDHSFNHGLHRIQNHLFTMEQPYRLSNADYVAAIQRCTELELQQIQRQISHAPPVIGLCGNPPSPLLDCILEQVQHSAMQQPAAPPLSRRSRRQPAPVAVQQLNVEQPALYMVGWPGVRLASADKFAIHGVWSLLGGKDGRLDQCLRIERSLAYSFAVYSREFLEDGYIFCFAYCEAQRMPQVVAAIHETIHGVQQTELSDQDTLYTHHRLINEFLLNLQSARTIATRACVYELAGMPPDALLNYPRWVQTVDRGAIEQAATTYFQTEHTVELVMMPQR